MATRSDSEVDVVGENRKPNRGRVWPLRVFVIDDAMICVFGQPAPGHVVSLGAAAGRPCHWR
jgi:hypothetical protein